MKKSTTGKLVLSRETVRSLNLGTVLGGMTYVQCQSGACPSDAVTCGTVNCTYDTTKC